MYDVDRSRTGLLLNLERAAAELRCAAAVTRAAQLDHGGDVPLGDPALELLAALAARVHVATRVILDREVRP